MQILVQLLLHSLIAGGIYSLVAAGFSLIYTTNKFIHFAHGAVVTVGAYALYQTSLLGLSLMASVVTSIIICMILGYILNKVIYKSLRKQSASSVIMLITSICLLILLESIILLIFGANVRTVSLLHASSSLQVFGAHITILQLLIVFSAVLLLLSLYLFMSKTKLGKAIRAVSNNKQLSEVIGISSERVYMSSFIIGSAIAGIAGILVGLEQNLDPMMGSKLMIKALAASVIGGIGNVYAAVLGAFFLGFAENFGIWYLPSGYKDAIAFGVLFIFLVFRPQGMMGQPESNIKVN